MKAPPFFSVAIVLVSVVLTACGSAGTRGPQSGTPEWYWLAAHETFEDGDYTKTQEHLEEVAESDTEWKQQAVVWRTMVLTGLSRGYMELGDAYADTIEQHEALAAELQNPIQQYRRDARQYSIELAESMGAVKKALEGAETVTFDFAFPSGSPNTSPLLTSLQAGQVPTQSQLLDAEKQTIDRGILLQASEMVGAGNEVNRARTMFENRPVEVSKTDFLWSLGESVYSMSGLFERERLNEPQVRKIMLQVALDCIGPALEAEDEKLKEQAEELKKEIEDEQGKLKV